MGFLDAFLISYSDSSFTNPHEVVRPDEPEECTGNFTHMGAKYWGFETARHRATVKTAIHRLVQSDSMELPVGLNTSGQYFSP